MATRSYDEEQFEADLLALLQADQTAKLVAIDTEKGADGKTPSAIDSDDWVDTLDNAWNNRTSFVWYGVQRMDPVDEDRGPDRTAREVAFVVMAFFPRENDVDARVKVFRYTRAFREIIEENARRLSYGDGIKVSQLPPEPLVEQETKSGYLAGGVVVRTTIV